MQKKKPVTKKVTKTAPKVITVTPLYKLTLKFNGLVYETETNDIAESILAVKPFSLKTKLYIKIEKEGKMCEKQYFPLQGRQLFRNTMFMKVLLNRLIFK